MDGHSVRGFIRWSAEYSGGYTIKILIENEDSITIMHVDYDDIIPDFDNKYGITEDFLKERVGKFLEHEIVHYNGCEGKVHTERGFMEVEVEDYQ
jgi:hypothetical protein